MRRVPENVIEHFGTVGRAGSFCRHQFLAKSGSDPPRDIALQREQIAGVAIEPLCPQMPPGLGVDKLSSYAERPPDR
jgi:hypothetical protein